MYRLPMSKPSTKLCQLLPKALSGEDAFDMLRQHEQRKVGEAKAIQKRKKKRKKGKRRKRGKEKRRKREEEKRNQ